MDQTGELRCSASRLRLRQFVAVLTACIACGCSSPGDVELLESQLRRQEDAIRTYRSQLSQSQQQLQRAQREIDQLNRQLAESQHESPTLLPEQVSALAQAEALAVDTWRTGFVDQDNHAGVDHLLLVLYPHDGDGEIVKVFGELEVEALDLTRQEEEQLIGHWTFSTEQTRDLWHVGFVSTGFHVNLPLPQQPNGTSLLLHASLTTVDGRRFAVTHSLPVRRRMDPVAPMPLIEPTLFPADVSHQEESTPEPLAETGRSVLVPEPPTDASFSSTGDDASEFVRGTDAAESNERANPAGFNRHVPVTTSDNWTVDEIPAWR